MSGPVVSSKRPAKPLDPDAAALAKGTDSLNAKLARAEQKLAAFGVEGAVALIDRSTWTHLAFRKLQNKWRLVLENLDHVHVVSELSRDLRVTAAMKLPELVEVLRERVREERARVEAANAALDAVLGEVQGVEAEDDDDFPF